MCEDDEYVVRLDKFKVSEPKWLISSDKDVFKLVLLRKQIYRFDKKESSVLSKQAFREQKQIFESREEKIYEINVGARQFSF